MRDGAEPPQSARDEGDEFITTSLDAPDRPEQAPVPAWRSMRARVVTLGVTALLVVVVAVGLVAHATSDPSVTIDALLRLSTPTPEATFSPGANVLLASDGAPWGTLTIDGRRMPTVDMLGAAFTVSRGAHRLVYQARYFPTLRCVFSAPPVDSDTCPLDTSDAASQFLLTHALGRVLDLGSTGLTLQSDQRAALTQLANSMLATQDVTEIIAPGDHYLDGQGHIVTATAPLRFSLRLSLGETEMPDVSGYCAQFCPTPSFTLGGQTDHQEWPTRISVTSAWEITDASGRAVTPPIYLAGQLFPSSNVLLIGVRLTPTGWEINGLGQQVNGAVSNAATAAVSALANQLNTNSYGMSSQVGQDALQGCVVGLTYSGKSARLLWRFGALLALDSATHQAFPQLPVATAAELALAAQMTQPA